MDTLKALSTATASGSMRQYEPAWRRFKEFCLARVLAYPCLPANPIHVAMYLHSVFQRAVAEKLQYGVVKLASPAIFFSPNGGHRAQSYIGSSGSYGEAERPPCARYGTRELKEPLAVGTV